MREYFVYVLRSIKNRKIYTGYTAEINKRIHRHNSRRVKSTKACVPLKLIYCERFTEKATAQRRERFLKSGKGRMVLENILNSGEVA
ncbi:MAG TPA: endonuclease [Elusimicrobia bacterium]|nr:MAG: hypothetical protein A2278_05260 [Elusimicrobia bacterium RIFOXYA12_FULL_49_49]OGS15239.1 MAG: hypothetical protein A2251_06990 [Elusimicrobia bacterium RIFOXYA2_FULL_47_53]OGS25906.1 MAG: hypothetical protein A2339_00815 [Elusimicrobia bacterium RIFOXYB12_FULL_50_12]OGS30290.1 MAG: hypothetical protein A2323_05565 [Elusimicrobia bacterium RIFOXYB2_FULL_46_23]HBU70435.1 endonuclease [Elusimicrobiota bacterium]